ncbi:hypothetical protein JTB14_031051 [Gonioctena quinquepunctata]|nr:hypothetical protein JTB14_031051 [Gonioctena quinquepunctata]
MIGFEENNCRLCKKVFCCKKCREKHEKTKHDINPECDICVYGNTVRSSILANLFHIKRRHWPLHCLICKRVFGSVNEIFDHTKCPAGYKNFNDVQRSPFTPVQSYAEIPYDSPPLSSDYLHEKDQRSNKKLNIVFNLATSTPMQREDNNLLEKIQEVIVTPDDYSENSKSSIIKKSNLDSNQGGSLKKRRVTFGETPIASYKSRNMTTTEAEDNQHSKDVDSKNYSGTSPSNYYTAQEELSQLTVEEDKKPEYIKDIPTVEVIDATDVKEDKTEDDQQKLDQDFVPVQTEEGNDTLWISAINMSTPDIRQNAPTLFVTPVVPNHKKKQINIVMPTPVIKEEIHIKFHEPIQISSTPNSSIIPVESAPNHRDIFRSEESLPTSSNSNLEFVETRSNDQIDTEEGTTDKKLSPKQDLADDCKNVATEFDDSSDSSVHYIWSSVSRIVKNVTRAIQGFSSVDGIVFSGSTKSLKRHSSDYDYDYMERPNIKRYKLTEIKCRRTIRELPPLERLMGHSVEESNEIRINIDVTNSGQKTFADKATQTDESVFFIN